MKKIGYIEKTMHSNRYIKEIEETDNCGTCDGACCEECKIIYIVEDFDTGKILYRGLDGEKAVEIAGYNFIK